METLNSDITIALKVYIYIFVQF